MCLVQHTIFHFIYAFFIHYIRNKNSVARETVESKRIHTIGRIVPSSSVIRLVIVTHYTAHIHPQTFIEWWKKVRGDTNKEKLSRKIFTLPLSWSLSLPLHRHSLKHSVFRAFRPFGSIHVDANGKTETTSTGEWKSVRALVHGKFCIEKSQSVRKMIEIYGERNTISISRHIPNIQQHIAIAIHTAYTVSPMSMSDETMIIPYAIFQLMFSCRWSNFVR